MKSAGHRPGARRLLWGFLALRLSALGFSVLELSTLSTSAIAQDNPSLPDQGSKQERTQTNNAGTETPLDAVNAQAHTSSHPNDTTASTTTPTPTPDTGYLRLGETMPSHDKPKETLWHASLDKGLGYHSVDDESIFDVGILNQLRYTAGYRSKEFVHNSFDFVVIRPYLRAQAWHRTLRFFVQPELSGASSRLLDLEVTWQPTPEFGLRVGQFLTPFSRAFFTPIPVLQMFDFSPVSVSFRADRQMGLMAYGMPMSGHLEYYAGIFNGNGINQPQDSNGTSMMGITRLVVNFLDPIPYDETPYIKNAGKVPLGVALGLGAVFNRAHPPATQTVTGTAMTTSTPLPPEDRLSLGTDLTIQYDRFTFITELFMREVWPDGLSRQKALGGYMQTGYFLMDRKLEAVLRTNLQDLKMGERGGRLRSIDIALNDYLVDNHFKGEVRYSMIKSDDAPNTGIEHRLTMLLQLWL